MCGSWAIIMTSPRFPLFIVQRAFWRTLWRSGAWIGIPIYLFYIFVPCYYEYIAKVPDESELYHDKGVFIYKHSGGRMGYLMGVESNGEKKYYTCSNGYGSRHDCIFSDEFKDLKRQSVSLWWFWQSTHWGSKHQRVVRLRINEHEWVTREGTELSIDRRKKNNVWFFSIYTLFCFLVMLFMYKAEKSDRSSELSGLGGV